jgi:hypothetical protein
MWNENESLEDIHIELENNIQSIRELVGKIEAFSGFGSLNVPHKNRDGSVNYPYWEQSDIVVSFVNLAHRIPLMVEYDWVSWKEGRKILLSGDFDLKTLDLLKKCKLITMMIRADRFNEGFLVQQFENGNVLRLLRSVVTELEGYK